MVEGLHTPYLDCVPESELLPDAVLVFETDNAQVFRHKEDDITQQEIDSLLSIFPEDQKESEDQTDGQPDNKKRASRRNKKMQE